MHLPLSGYRILDLDDESAGSAAAAECLPIHIVSQPFGGGQSGGERQGRITQESSPPEVAQSDGGIDQKFAVA